MELLIFWAKEDTEKQMDISKNTDLNPLTKLSRPTMQRHIPLQGCSNFRDLGGYIGHQGRALRWGKLFRTDHLADLSASDLAQLNHLGIARTVDFRGSEERRKHGYHWPQWQQHVLAVEPLLIEQRLAAVKAGNCISPQETVALMQATYRSFVLDDAPQFAQWFALLLEDDSPLAFHCTAGKDRTGWAAAMLLHALGVAPSVITQDYLLTNTLYQRPAALAQEARRHLPEAVLQVLWGVQAAFLNSAYTTVQQAYGDMPTYLEQAMGLHQAALAQLRACYLQP